VFLLDITEYLISASELLLSTILINNLLYKTVERDDVRMKRRNESDVDKFNPADGV
jgi:hypothetical protein